MKTKLLLISLLSLIFVNTAFAQRSCVGGGTIVIDGVVISALANDAYLGSTDAAGTGTVSLIKADAADNTVINSDPLKAIILQAREDAQRLMTYDAASDTALTLKFGDSSVTAVQQLTISASTTDADDDSTLIVAGGGANGGTRGASITLPGEEVAGGSDITYNAGTGDTHIFQVAGTTEATISDDALTFTGASASLAFGATSGIVKVNGNAEITFGDDTITYNGANAFLYTTGTALTYFPASDLNRRFTLTAAGDVNHYFQFGDGGTTATQDLYIAAGTPDGDDDSTAYLCGGGASGATRGGCITLRGEEVAGGGDITLTSGASDSISLTSGDVLVSGTLDFTGNDAGWRAAAAANQACTTTCGAGKGCLLGFDAGTTALVDCASALADTCICSTT